MKKHLARLRGWFSSLGLNYRFTAVFAVTLFLSMHTLGTLVRPYGMQSRAMICQFIARSVQAQGAKALQAGNNYLNSLREDLAFLGWEVWITDENGSIISSSLAHSLPMDWSLLPKPIEEFELGWGPAIKAPNPNVLVMRLVSNPVRFMVFYADYSKNFEGKIMVGALAVFIFIVLLAHLVLTYAMGRLKFTRLKTQSGFTLLEALVVIVLLSISLFIFLQFMKLSTRSTSHTNVKLAITSLSDTIRNGIDCEQTIAKNTFSRPLNCQAGTYKALELYDSRGVRLGTPITAVSGAFDPLANSNVGASQIGNWSVRAYCDSASDSLVVRFARFGNAGAFYADPLLKRPYDWKDSPDNPLFGTADRQLCKGISSNTPGGGSSQVVIGNFSPAPLGQRNCTSSFDKNGKTYLVAIGAPEYILLIPDSARIVANVQCPSGMKVISGGADCGTGLSTGNAVAPGDPGGNISSSYPSADGSGWNATCCVEGTPRGDARIYALCGAR